MITNSGYGGVSQALYNNTKLICTGDSEDKAEIRARVEYADVGINLKKQRLNQLKMHI